MSENIAALSEQELAELIAKASRELEAKRHGKKREVIAQIKELAASIGVHVEISEGEKKPASRKGSTVPIKYRDPTNPKNAWTGRGMKPRWLSALLEQGHSLDEFRV
ncbi:H-NS histone family protein [Candidatus Methylocalor cossyra]|uniref:DNA-binding protein H-NS n=1 Tax=Candidatus Methylocalor cossyra TaxID=3108543 RepID=A0ABP1CB10_9GAMM